MIGLMELAAAELDCPDFGMRLGKRQTGASMFGPLGLVMKNSRTFGDALEYVSKHTYAHSLAARETELLAFAIAAHDDSRRRWQPSFFDRRAERVVEASRLDLTRLTTEHQRRIRDLARPAASPRLEPVLALLVR